MKIRSIFIPILLAAGMLLALGLPASAQEEGFSETFDTSTLPGWELHPELASVTEGVLQISPGGYALHFGDWSEISFTIKVSFSGEGEAVIRYYQRDKGEYSLVLAAGSLSVEKRQEGSSSTLGQAEADTLQPGEWYTIGVTYVDGQHQVSVDNELLLTVSDTEPLEAGAVLLTCRGGAMAEFDDLELTGIPFLETRPPEGTLAGEEQPPLASTPAAPIETSTDGTDTVGGARSLIEEFFSSQASTIELTDFLINLLLAAACSYILGIVYANWGTSLSNRRKFASNFLLMTITTTFIIMVVRSSVALSLGLVGALSIVRFRSAVKEPEELAYLFFALGIGIGLGDNQRMITLVAMAVGIGLLGIRHLFHRPDADVNLHVSIASQSPADVPLGKITRTLAGLCTKVKLVRYDETTTAMEASYMVELRRMDQLNEVRTALKEMSPSLEITFMDNKGIW